jgi:hypothetical protein
MRFATARVVMLVALSILSFTCLLGNARAEAPKQTLKSPPNPERPTEVSLAFFVLNLGRINQTDETMDLGGLVTTTWMDKRLAFTPSEGEEKVRRYTLDQIWVPELTIINAANLQRRTLLELSVKPDGSVKWIEFVAVTASSSFNLKHFPFDTQEALIIWSPMSSGVQPLKLVANKVEAAEGFCLDDYVALSEWEMLSHKSEITETPPSKHEKDPYPRVTFTMKIKRNYGFYLFKVAFPLLLITIISWTAFWINPATGFAQQLTVGITSILAAITFNLTITNALPRVPYATLMDGFVATCYLFFFASILGTVFIHYLLTQQKTDRALKTIRNFRWIFPLVFVFAQGGVVSAFLFT